MNPGASSSAFLPVLLVIHDLYMAESQRREKYEASASLFVELQKKTKRFWSELLWCTANSGVLNDLQHARALRPGLNAHGTWKACRMGACLLGCSSRMRKTTCSLQPFVVEPSGFHLSRVAILQSRVISDVHQGTTIAHNLFETDLARLFLQENEKLHFNTMHPAKSKFVKSLT